MIKLIVFVDRAHAGRSVANMHAVLFDYVDGGVQATEFYGRIAFDSDIVVSLKDYGLEFPDSSDYSYSGLSHVIKTKTNGKLCLQARSIVLDYVEYKVLVMRELRQIGLDPSRGDSPPPIDDAFFAQATERPLGRLVYRDAAFSGDACLAKRVIDEFAARGLF